MLFLPAFITAIVAFAAITTAFPHWHPRIKGAHSLAGKTCGCKLDKAVLPTIDEPGYAQLTPPSTVHPIRVVLGHGTQNYTCATNTAASIPVANGARAELYDASCLAQDYPQLLHRLPAALVTMDTHKVGRYITRQLSLFDRSDIAVGYHIFPDPTTPVFNYKKERPDDVFVGKKLEGVPAPSTAATGRWGTVDWLLISAIQTGPLKYGAAYRVVTAGGKAPADCSGQEKNFEVPYATEYWFYE